MDRVADDTAGQRPLARPVRSDQAGPLRLHRRRLDRPVQDLEQAARQAHRGGPGREGRPGDRSSPGRGRRGEGAGRGRRQAHHARPGAAQTGRGAARGRGRAAGGADGPPCRPQPVHLLRPRAHGRRRAGARAIRRLVRTLPALVRQGRRARHVPRPGAAAALRLGDGLRHPVPAADPPHRQDPPQGPEQQRARHGGRPRTSVGHRVRAGRPQVREPRARHAGRLQAVRARRGRAWPGGRARHRVPVLARPPLRAPASGMVQAPSRRHDPVRGESAEEVRGHRPIRFRDRELARAVAGAPVRRAVLDRAGRAHLPGRQPAHQALRLLGVAHRRGQAELARRHLPVRGVHPAQGHVPARQARVQPVVHVPRLAQHGLGDCAVLHRADPAAGRRLLAAEPVAQHARHPERVPAERWPARVRRALPARGDAGRQLWPLRPGLRAGRGAAARVGLRGVPRFREVPAAGLEPGQPGEPARIDHSRQQGPPREPGAADRPHAALPPDGERVPGRLHEEHREPERRRAHGGQRRSPSPPGRHGHAAARGARPSARQGIPGARAAHRGALRVERASQLRGDQSLVGAGPDLPLPAPGPQRARLRVFPVIETTPVIRRKKVPETFKLDDDPLWYKDAIIYELHVRAFSDSDGDGSGDFRGLLDKLPYLQELGVSAIWLLPFYPSPLRDDGYDIADYTDVNPMFGDLGDAQQFIKEAHRRGIRVITELVCNHTSDQHPWFQRARRARPGSVYREFYVWSETNQRYTDARIIFKDFEVSNWTWDQVANAYYWHRFYSHQPDLNYDNPRVKEAIFKTVDYWLELGVDGLRLDAVPYLFEREGTNCENLPETHEFLRELRHHMDSHFPNRMLLAEANQWPEDAVAYFGNGDEAQMNFHFPLMPRLFMSIRMEDRFPIVDILAQTPPIPDNSQWALFLRNHDELTLEMVTDEERDYMYRSYTQDRAARINLGIRRRLAPLLGNDRKRIELMNGLLLSLPGTPVIYYGDEIGMGDNIFLGDRNGVRTPMQWSGDRNAGFSRSNRQRLYLPVVTDPEYHYEAVNVEAQAANQHSLLSWMKRLIALRKRHRAFGRGTLELLRPENRKVLAFVRRHESEQILCIANLSRFVQYAQLDLSKFKGMVPVELFGSTELPVVGDTPYFLTLGPHSFYWFSMQPKASAQLGSDSSLTATTLPEIRVPAGWETLLSAPAKERLENVLMRYVRQRRWFAGKARKLKSILISDSIDIRTHDGTAYLCTLLAAYAEGDPETYMLPVAYASAAEATHIIERWPHAAIAWVRGLRPADGSQDGGGEQRGLL